MVNQENRPTSIGWLKRLKGEKLSTCYIQVLFPQENLKRAVENIGKNTLGSEK